MNLAIPILETDRLILRRFKERDFSNLAAIQGDEELTRFVGGPLSASDTWRWMATTLGHWVLRGFGFFCVEEKVSAECIGFCGPWRPHGWPENEIGYTLAKRCHGKGYATEGARASLKYAYENLGWTTAIGLIDSKNTASQGVAKKLGAVLESRDVSVTDFTCDIWRYPSPQNFTN